MKRAVVDASVVVKNFFEEEFSLKAEQLLARASELLAPTFVFVEVANVVWKRATRTELAFDDAAAILSDVLSLQLVIEDAKLLLPDAFRLAAATGRTVYDCTYLALALREKCQLITADERFFNSLRQTPFASNVEHLKSVRL